jgi:hypothetical protein
VAIAIGELISVGRKLKVGGFPGGGCANAKGVEGCVVKPSEPLMFSGGDLRFCDAESEDIFRMLIFLFKMKSFREQN